MNIQYKNKKYKQSKKLLYNYCLESRLATVQFKSWSQGRVVEPYSPRDTWLAQAVCRAGQGQQPVTEGASLPGKALVKGVEDIVQDGQHLVDDPFLSYRCQGVQFSTNYWSSLPHQFVQSRGVRPLNAASPAHHSIEENAGDDSLIEHLWQILTDVKRPQPLQEVESALSIPFRVWGPVQSVV